MFKKLAKSSLFAAAATIAVLPMLGAVPAVAQDGENIDVTIGWVPPDITGVFKTATNFFELAAEDANKNGFNVKVLTKSPTSPTAFAEQVSIIEDMIQRKVDLIAVSPAEVATVKPALARATAAGIPVVVVNLLEPIDGVDVSSYIGFDNTQGAEVSAYSVVDYFGGPGVLGTGDKVDVEPGTYLDLKFWEDNRWGCRGRVGRADGNRSHSRIQSRTVHQYLAGAYAGQAPRPAVGSGGRCRRA